MVEDAPAVLAERGTSALPPHIFQGVRFESQLFSGFCRGEKLVSSLIGHVVPRMNGTGQKFRENMIDGECRTGVGMRDTPVLAIAEIEAASWGACAPPW